MMMRFFPPLPRLPNLFYPEISFFLYIICIYHYHDTAYVGSL